MCGVWEIMSSIVHFVFPNEHSTRPSSGPKVKIGVRSSSKDLPSNRNDCFSAPSINSFSEMDGDGGRIALRLGLPDLEWRFQSHQCNVTVQRDLPSCILYTCEVTLECRDHSRL